MRKILAFLCMSACAQMAWSYQPGTGWYVGAAVGDNLTDNVDIARTVTIPPISGNNQLRANMDDSAAFGAVVGYRISSAIRVEGEFYHRYSTSDSVKIIGGGTAANSLNRKTNSLMGNAVYSFNMASSVYPYLGVGLGAARVVLKKSDSLGDASKSNYAFAFQGLAGVEWLFAPSTSLFLQYQNFNVTGQKFRLVSSRGNQTNAWVIKDGFNNQTISLGLRYSV